MTAISIVYVLTETTEDDSEFPVVTIGVYRNADAAIAEANRLSIERYHVSVEVDEEDRDTTWLIEEHPLQ